MPEPNQVWCGDITYIWAQGKRHYLAVVLNIYARRIVRWALSNKPGTDLVIKALDMAYEQRGRPQGLLFTRIRARNMEAASFANGSGVTACAKA